MTELMRICNKYIEKGETMKARTYCSRLQGHGPEVFDLMAKCHEGASLNGDMALVRKFRWLRRRAYKREVETNRRDGRILRQAARDGMTAIRVPSKRRRIKCRIETLRWRVQGDIEASRIRKEKRNLDRYGRDVAMKALVLVMGEGAKGERNWIQKLEDAL